MKHPIQLTEITGQATASAAGRVIVTLPQGFRVYSLLMNLTTAVSGELGTNYPNECYTKINGVQQRGITPLAIDALNRLNNHPAGTLGTPGTTPYSKLADSTTLCLLEEYFGEPWNGQFAAQDRFALDIPEGVVVTKEVQFASVAVAPIVTFRAIVEPLADVMRSGRPLNVTPQGRPTLVKYSTGQETPGGTTLDITKITASFSSNDVIQHIRLIQNTQTIDSVQAMLNGREIFFRTKQENAKELRSQNMDPKSTYTAASLSDAALTGFFDIVFNASGNPEDGIIVGPSDKLLQKLTFSASSTNPVNYIVQHFGAAN